MATYGSAVIPHLNQVPEDIEAGQLTPLHGGVIGGHEFDLQTAQMASSTQPPPPSNAFTSPAPRPTFLSNKPRPVSMPPQSYAAALPASTTATGSATTTSSDTKERSRMPSNNDTAQPRRQHRDSSSGTKQTRSNRILGDYTLSKTLGAGSMGKVKLATHNITGEKVRDSFSLQPSPLLMTATSLPSRSYHEFSQTLGHILMVLPNLPPRSKRPRTPPRKSARSAKLPSPCCCTTRISVACER